MNLIFPERTCSPPAKHFPISAEVISRLHRRKSAKRERQDDEETQTNNGVKTGDDLNLAVAPRQVLPDSLLKCIYECIEHGRDSLREDSGLRAANGVSDSARRMTLLQSALSILCQISAMDRSRFFISRGAKSSQNSTNIKVHGNNDMKRKSSGDASDALNSRFSLTDIYTTVRALKLEYEDVLSQQKGGSGKQQMNAQSVAASILTSEARVDDSLDLLEQTLVQMILDFDRADDVSVEYVDEILRMMSRFFVREKWPLKVLESDESQNMQEKRLSEAEHDIWKDVSHAATAIILKSLQALKKDDCFGILETGKYSSTTLRRSHTQQLPITFEEIVSKALKGAYRWRGLFGAMHDMKLVLYGLYTVVPSDQKKVITSMRLQFDRLMRTHYGLFLRRMGLSEGVENLLLPEDNMFRVNPLPTEANSGLYTDTQLKCLKVLDLLREVDPQGWFENPVFDLANIELSSVERWIRTPLFGTKRNRDAFIALRDVLEQMVDNCVMTYGPNSRYSEVITLVRKRLVDAAREVELL